MAENIANKQKVNVVIVNYNSWNHTLACLGTIYRSNYKNYQIFIVDNNSLDDSIEKIKNAHLEQKKSFIEISLKASKTINYINQIDNSNVVLFKNTNNLGFGAGNNIALNYLIENRDDEYVWLLNPDTEVEESVMIDLVEITKKKRKTISGNLIHYYNDKDNIMYCGGFRVRKYIHGIKRIIKYDNIKRIDAIAGTSLFTHLSTYKDLGLLPEDYFMYWEETDFCTNAKKKGYNFSVNCKSKVYDHVGSSSNSNFLREYLYLLNGLRYYKKYYKTHLFFILLSSIAKFFKALIFIDKVKLRALFWAHIDFLKILLGKEINIKSRIANNKLNE